MNWFWSYLTFQRGTRLITGISGSRIEDIVPAAPLVPAEGTLSDLEIAQRLRSPVESHLERRYS